ncbi:MAG TPA: hypothetical protein VER04_23960 [Polyangiaceae bacterium]|nr:hypothetical protein [Polyangiaceae bacterium]
MKSFIDSRLRQRGAAFIESLIVISMILFCLFAVLWFQSLYATKLQVMQSVRANAWTSALGGCQVASQSPPGLEQTQVLLSQSANDSNSTGAKGRGDSTEGDASGLTANTQGDSTPDWFALREGGQSEQSVDFPNFGKEGSMSVATRRKLQCNERRNAEELKLSTGDLLSNLASVMRDLFN